MSTADTGTEVLLVDVGAVRLAIPVVTVMGVDLDDAAPVVDMHQAWNQRAGDGERRRIRVRGRAPFDLSVRSTLRVEHVRVEDLQPLPAFLQGMRGRLGLVGLLRVGEQFALYVDPSALEGSA